MPKLFKLQTDAVVKLSVWDILSIQLDSWEVDNVCRRVLRSFDTFFGNTEFYWSVILSEVS